MEKERYMRNMQRMLNQYEKRFGENRKKNTAIDIITASELAQIVEISGSKAKHPADIMWYLIVDSLKIGYVMGCNKARR